MSSDVAKLVAGLTEAQRTVMLRFSPDAADTEELIHIQTRDEERSVVELLRLGLAAHVRAVFVFAQLTPLGLAVRQYLTENSRGAE